MTPGTLFAYVIAAGFGLALTVMAMGLCAGLVGIAFGWSKEDRS